MARYHITIIRPQGYIHSDCFREVAEGLRSALRSLGHTADISENTMHSTSTNILLGANLLSEQEAMRLHPGTIVYNLEQLGGSPVPAWYSTLATRFRVWDYSQLNLARWEQTDCREKPTLVEVGYSPDLRRVPLAPFQDIDVLFYGSINERRLRILQSVEASGLKVYAFFGMYGNDRDALISRSKVVLNIHAFATENLEIVRISYLLTNSKAAVTENSPDLGELSEAVAIATYDGLAARCKKLIENEEERYALEARGFRLFSSRSQSEILKPIVGLSIQAAV
jgi:hypothetical protein